MTDSFDVDVVVVGAGIHGAGMAQAVAAAGHSVWLLERTAIAIGSSSRSSKLIHGGLRCAVIRRSTAAAFSSAVSATKKARATPTWDGSKPKPLASIAAL